MKIIEELVKKLRNICGSWMIHMHIDITNSDGNDLTYKINFRYKYHQLIEGNYQKLKQQK